MNEINISAKLTASKGGTSVSNATSSKTQSIQSTLAGHPADVVQSVGTSAEDVATDDVDVTAQYWLLLRNMDPTNFVTVSILKDVSTSTNVGVMLPGETFGPIRCPLQAAGYPKYQVKADTAACDVERVLTEAGNPSL